MRDDSGRDCVGAFTDDWVALIFGAKLIATTKLRQEHHFSRDIST
jgi:hypothetical protein